ncbi:hypothetical protein [Ruminiclostridium cellobioparum]|jgi:uncharacterized membrane protein|uniref:hypothetical protein n=1 Tax=Ruminiclostridium cellobioparum TaxID=29355 RepID=UPI0028AC7800|nr:hypothetical protein [Ruminiclostridium cellobioparum]
MKYLLLVVLMLVSIYPLSYAVYNIKHNKIYPALGCILLIIISFGISIYRAFFI